MEGKVFIRVEVDKELWKCVKLEAVREEKTVSEKLEEIIKKYFSERRK